MQSKPIEYIKTSKLSFDPENPRFFRLNDADKEEVVVEGMLDDESVHDLMLSIGQQGYFPGEPLLVFRSGKELIVAEGNRRLAAVKLLNGQLNPPDNKKNSIQEIRGEVTNKPNELPCIIYDAREDVLRYIGYRHITGVKEWDSLSKAKYLKELCVKFYGNETKENTLKYLAREIGSRPSYVGLLLTSLSVYELAKKEKFYKLNILEVDIEFSYLTTALGYSAITEWLGIEDKKDYDLKGIKEENVKNIFSWFFVRDEHARTVVRESRRIKDIALIVQHDDAIECLVRTRDIDQSYLYTNGHQVALEEAIKKAKNSLKIVWDMLLKDKNYTSIDLDAAEQLFDMSKTIRNHIRTELEDE
ncbi:hypothetical protein ACOM1Z_003157 [Cronobacter dublinensis]